MSSHQREPTPFYLGRFGNSVPIMLALAVLTFSFPQDSEGKALRIATIDLAPSGYQENGEIKGISYEFSNLIAEKAGLSYTNVLKPYSRVVHELKTGKSDMSILIYHESFNTATLLKLLTLETIIIGRKGHDIKRLSELNGKTVGIVRGTKFTEITDTNNMVLLNVKSYQHGIRMLDKGRITALIALKGSLYFVIKNLNVEKSEFGKPYVISERPVFLQVSQSFRDTDKIYALESAAKQLVKDGTFQRVMDKYVPGFLDSSLK
ncbi:transporter substrate-binding domain-containing protein [Vibrio profundum]|uniref:substrate-binding periplasmic protein n=1 Tax=Vibrio profundum TaxID=2910247 RepID=UPI003D0F8CC6